jgi:hypothetical protein
MKKLLIVALSFATFASFAADKPVEKKAEAKPVVVKAKAPAAKKAPAKKADAPKDAQAKADAATDKLKVK